VADLQAHVPQAVEDRFGDLFAPRGLLVGEHEQQIDVGFRRQLAAPVAAGRNHGHALGLGAVLGPVQVLGRRAEQQTDDVVLHPAKPLGASAAMAVFQQLRFGPLARRPELGLERLRQGNAERIVVAGVTLGESVDRRLDAAGVEYLRAGSRRGGDLIHRLGDNEAVAGCHERSSRRARLSA
jgi:hypothetical protein